MIAAHNFSAGPGALPASVLQATQEAIAAVPGEGLSVLGLSHRSEWFRQVVDEAEDHFRHLLGCPPEYRILFLQGGSTQQFSQIPMTLLRGASRPAGYLHTGYWSGKSIPEARREGPVQVLWSGESEGFRRLPSARELPDVPGSPYFHYVSNETVEGLQFHSIPGRDDVPRICDMSSDLCSRPVEVTRFALLYAHAQKNLGPSGVTVVILHEDILRRTPPNLPAMLDYRLHAEAHSIYNTPPVFAIFVTMLVARWLRHEVGGLAAMGKLNQEKAGRLYRALEACPGFYRVRAAKPDRSWMNVVFELLDARLIPRLLASARDEGLHGLDGHRSLPDTLRASLYNAVTLSSVDTLVSFLSDFARRHG